MFSAKPKPTQSVPAKALFTRPAAAKALGGAAAAVSPTTKAQGNWAEDWAVQHLQNHGLRLLARNFKTPGRGGGEIDLIMQERDHTVVFVEVRWRRSAGFGGAAASVGVGKQRRIVYAARHYLRRFASCPPCRFDVLAISGERPDVRAQWLQAAFDAGD